MRVGFKAGPRNWDEARALVDGGAQLCEVWFDVTRAETYEEILNWFSTQKVRVGLHHWGLAPGSIKTNLMTNDADVRAETMAQVKQTIDIGARHECAYVNVHPGAEAIERLDFTTDQQSLIIDAVRTPPDVAVRLLQEAAQELFIYAESRGVLLTIETLPARESEQLGHRGPDIYDPGNTTLDQMLALGSAGLWLANDITHTAGQVAVETTERETMWEKVYAFSTAAAPRTRLVHINTVQEPFDGTDSHNGILPNDFAQGVWPTREQLKEFLRLFIERDDVYAIPEPRQDMTANYRELLKLVSEID